MKVLQRIAALFIFFLMIYLLTLSTYAKNEETYEVIANTLNVRVTPSTNGEIVGALHKGEKINVIDEASGWFLTEFNGGFAWVSAAYLVPQELQQSEVTDKVLKGFTIVIDPGHGGKDPGAIGQNGVREKDLIMSTANKLAEQLRLTGAKVILTRSEDYFVSLNKRIHISNTSNADAFVSIHFNSFSMDTVGGFNTYFHSYGDDLKLAQEIHSALDTEITLRNRGMIQDDYRVLRKNNIPAVLVELGFITNTNELQVLQTDDFQSSVAKAIKNGVQNYLLQ
ncbi:N-acetylmuramoyl-L-alanine amidase [Oceanobacillus limi]|uniref:N-acetylmuramoyl-L-alanine amidase n=1 Tax=Oceanobacillus limi TaxID=930131 RepID=A0A1I0EZB0_9BACI|nr:N-acetylmuramoyl-L-alanine amidase [Oceanobacillus limi]SET50480.1 N-acetylmuramoyl-L-alanine amidase [Oceanobacillus limi]